MQKTRWFTVSLAITLISIITLHFGATPLKAEGEWYAEYFNNTTLSGGAVLTRYDENVDFDWGTGSPGAGVASDNFSARWVRDIWFDAATYRFSYAADDGIRIWVDDQLVVDDWQDGSASWKFVDRVLSAGVHKVRVEYYEHTGGARIKINLERINKDEVWRAEYYANAGLEGDAAFVRYDSAIDFDWGTGSPDTVIPADYFSVRWSQTLGFEPGSYRFYASCDDGVRISVDGQRIVDVWQHQKLPNTNSGDITLSAGLHTVVVEYFEHGGEAAAHVWWTRPASFQSWEGRYYDNVEFKGGPALIRDDAEINFDWGEGAPASWMQSDHFSAMWSRTITFAPGFYRFNVRADDGIRLWLDGVDLLMDYWEPQDFTWNYRNWHYLEGTHTLRLEYFEGTGSAKVQLWWDYALTEASAESTPPSPTYQFKTITTPAVTATKTPAQTTITAASGTTTQPASQAPGPWKAEYFNGQDFTPTPVLVRTDDAIDFNWGWNSPADAVDKNDFAVRWTGTFAFEAGRYRLTSYTDDGIRIYVDDELVINSWRKMRGYNTTYVTLDAGEHTVRVEYFEGSQAARAKVSWDKVGTATTAPQPTSQPMPAKDNPAVSAGPWDIEYYDNANLEGDPVVALKSQDTDLDYNWGTDSPNAKIPEDYFSGRWEQERAFEEGRYRFTTTSDDGVRLYIDDKLVIGNWWPMRGSRAVTLDLEKGKHTIRLEYFERTGAAQLKLVWQKQ